MVLCITISVAYRLRCYVALAIFNRINFSNTEQFVDLPVKQFRSLNGDNRVTLLLPVRHTTRRCRCRYEAITAAQRLTARIPDVQLASAVYRRSRFPAALRCIPRLRRYHKTSPQAAQCSTQMPRQMTKLLQSSRRTNFTICEQLTNWRQKAVVNED